MALRVLLADNSESIKKVMQISLQDYAIDLRIVTIGLDVLDVAKKFKPDIIFIDILLQKKTGYEVSQELKSDSETSKIPTVLMWSGFMDFDEKKAKESLADARLEKPFESSTLRDLVKKLVPKVSTQKLSDFLDFPTPPKTTKGTKEDPLLTLEKVKNESLKFSQDQKNPALDTEQKMHVKPSSSAVAPSLNTIHLDAPKNLTPPKDIARDLSSPITQEDKVPEDEFQMGPLHNTLQSPMGMEPPLANALPPSIEKEEFSMEDRPTSIFKLDLPDDAQEDDLHLEVTNIDKVEDLSFLLNPEAAGSASTSQAQGSNQQMPSRTSSQGEAPHRPQDNHPNHGHLNQSHPSQRKEMPPLNPTPLNPTPKATPRLPDYGDSKEPSETAETPTDTHELTSSKAPLISKDEIEKIIRNQAQEVLEKMAWDLVPELASQLIKKELERLLKESGSLK